MSNAPASNAADRPSIALPVIALVCFFLCFPIGTILSIVAFVMYNKHPGTEARTLSIVALCANVVVVPMIGILAAIAIPNFLMFQCKYKQSEAKGNLKALAVAQESHLAERGEYARDLTAIGFQPRGNKIRYEYVIVQAGKASYVAEARGITDVVTGDLWRIDEKYIPQNVTNACKR
jgi:type IV pilus assembly protein PilA